MAATIPGTGTSRENKTGGWRSFKPEVDKNVCKYCGICETFCPDGIIEVDREKKQHKIDYDFCKGCGICAQVCPFKAVKMVVEKK